MIDKKWPTWDSAQRARDLLRAREALDQAIASGIPFKFQLVPMNGDQMFYMEVKGEHGVEGEHSR